MRRTPRPPSPPTPPPPPPPSLPPAEDLPYDYAAALTPSTPAASLHASAHQAAGGLSLSHHAGSASATLPPSSVHAAARPASPAGSSEGDWVQIEPEVGDAGGAPAGVV